MKYRILLLAAALLMSQMACEALNPLNALDGLDPEALLDALPEDMDPEAILETLPEDMDPEAIMETLPEEMGEMESMMEEALPGEDEQAPPPDPGNLASITAAGITLEYDQNLLPDVQAEAVPAMTEPMAYETMHPEYALFTFPGMEGYLAVVPVGPMKQVVPESADTFQLLQNALAAKPGSFDTCVPQVPIVNFYHECSHQQLASNIGYIDFMNGSGIRYASVYAIQDLAPITNEYLVYNFVGFTAEGQYYLFGEMQIENEMLAMAGELIPEDVYTDMEGTIMREYFKGWESALNEAGVLYDPALEDIDRVFQSMRVR